MEGSKVDKRASHACYEEARAERKKLLTPAHMYMIRRLAIVLNLTPTEVEDFILDSPSLDAFDHFLAAGGGRTISFVYQESGVPGEECGRTYLGPTKDGKIQRLLLANLADTRLTGLCCVFTRTKTDVPVNPEKIHEDIFFSVIDTRDDRLKGLKDANSFLLLAVEAQEDWGAVGTSVQRDEIKHNFLDEFKGFLQSLNDLQAREQSCDHLTAVTDVDFSKLASPDDIKPAASNPDTVEQMEEMLIQWFKQILKATRKLNVEDVPSFTGSLQEMEYWQKLDKKYSSIISHMKSPQCKAVVDVLRFKPCMILKKWLEKENEISHRANVAKEHVKFLSLQETFFSSNPVSMTNTVQSLVSTFSRIYCESQNYRTDEMTPFFSKVTHQMIVACRAYITDNKSFMWDQDPEDLHRKIQECLCLFQEYQSCIQKAALPTVESPGEKPVEALQWFIAADLKKFTKKLEKINQIISMLKTFATLEKSRIEGIEIIARLFQTAITGIKKGDDILSPEENEFEADYEKFMADICYIEEQLQILMTSIFTKFTSSKVTSSQTCISFIEGFKKLNIPCVDNKIPEVSKLILQHHIQKLEFVKKDFFQNQDHPVCYSTSSSVASRIPWDRDLCKNTEDILLYLKENTDFLSHPDVQYKVRECSSIADMLKEFETSEHQRWMKKASDLTDVMNSPVLIRDPKAGTMVVNFDLRVMEVVMEAKYYSQMGLEIPEQALVLVQMEKTLNGYLRRLKTILEDFKSTCESIPTEQRIIFSSKMENVDSALGPGSELLTWSSDLNDFLQNAEVALLKLKNEAKKIHDICEANVDDVLDAISKTELIELPEKETSLLDFVDHNKNRCKEWAKTFDLKCVHVKYALHELGYMLGDIHQPKDSKMEEDAVLATSIRLESQKTKIRKDEVVSENQLKKKQKKKVFKNLCSLFSEKVCEALVKTTLLSLETLANRTQWVTAHKTSQSQCKLAPLIKAEVQLEKPVVVMSPSVEEIQEAINGLISSVLEVSKAIVWEEEYSWDAIQGREKDYFYQQVINHNDILRLVDLLKSTFSSKKSEVLDVLKQFYTFSGLWEDNNLKIEEFMNSNPPLTQIESLIQHYVSFEQQIDDIESEIAFGPVKLSTGPLQNALKAEMKAWKELICRYLQQTYRRKLVDTSIQTNEQWAQLSHPVADLEDFRRSSDVLRQLRETDIDTEITLIAIKDAYKILTTYKADIDENEREEVDNLWKLFTDLLSKARSVQNELYRKEPELKKTLVMSVGVFKKDINTFMDQYAREGPLVEGVAPQVASQRLQVFQAKFEDLWKKFITYRAGEELLRLPVTEYDCLHQKQKELELLQKLYGLYDAVMSKISGYYKVLWTQVDIEKINGELQEFQNRCRKLPKAMKEWRAFLDLKKTIDDFNELCPLLEMMTNKSMSRRHWDRISSLTQHQLEVESSTFTLQDIMEAHPLTYKDDIEDICISAVKEKDIEAKLSQVKELWSGQTLSLMTFKNRGELMLKGAETSEVFTNLEDSLMVLGSLLTNRYSTYYKPDLQDWVSKLSRSSEIIEQWIIIQNLWIYLEAVFVGGDIAKDLPQETKQFQDIDKSWIKIMERAQKIPNVVECCASDPFLEHRLPELQRQLELCQKSLAGYLEKKRLLFPRFFFVSDPALLEILGQASDSHTIRSHLLKVFDNVNDVEFDPADYDKILSVISQEGEQLLLNQPVMAQGPVEHWLGQLLVEQQASLHSVVSACHGFINSEEFKLLSFLKTYQAQVGLLGIQMLWTRDAEDALHNAKTQKEAMPHAQKRFLNQLDVLVSQTTHDLSKFDRVKYETLVTIHVHQTDIFNDLVKKSITSVDDFEWLKQSRFYYKEIQDDVTVSITNVDFVYQNEFLGCTDRLVITPLTDRCYITLAQALGMNMGGAPAGPAGTGKTETTKDMGRCLGKFVVVFNCSDQMDFRGLGRIFKGLAQSGSWGCFDEFNRIDLPVLSVAAQQISIVLTARKCLHQTFVFTDGDCVNLNPEFGLFITMNPGYAGRQELPENLKVQFRTVSMMVPDRQIIMRVKLASCGFHDSVMLAQKFFVLYKLCEEQLTKQVHYDFGLRNILSVLRTLGTCKRARPTDTESSIVMRVLRDMNLSKLVDEDEPLFLRLISDLFPGIQLDKNTYNELQTAVSHQVELAGLVNHPPWNLKLIQLYETSQVRHGLMTLGPSGAGKTTAINILMQSMTECGTPHKEMRMNPKAITAAQMFGRLDAATNDWTDGIFSTLWRKSLKAKKGDSIWIVLDGPVDAIWIENLNSVLDDNKTLTLANGDRITMSPSCKLVFEVHNMENASPATVSRVGMVYMSSSVLSWRPILQGWVKKRKEADIILGLFDKTFEDFYLYVKQTLKPKMEFLECNYIMQSVNLLYGLLPTKEMEDFAESKLLERLFVFCLMWSLGALLELEDRDKLEAYIRGHESNVDLPQTKPGETMFEYMVDENGEWCHWNSHVGEYVYPTDHIPDYTSILVPNVDNTRTAFLLETIAKQHKAVLLIGEQGTAKTVMIKSYTKKYDPETDLFKSLNFSSATEPMMFQRSVESYTEKRLGSIYGPPGGRRMTIFIDDINMPLVNEWGDQITNEIVRQMMEMKGMYSLDKPGDFLTIQDVQILAAMIHPGGGRNDIPQRLKRQFTVFNCTLPSNASIDKIFGVIGNGYFHKCRKFEPQITAMITSLVSASRILWQWTKAKMLPTPSKFHYIFNLRDLSRIWQGMLKIKAEECGDILTLLALFKSECSRVIADRFVCPEDREWFTKAVSRVIQDHVDPQHVQALHPEPFFVDFLRDAPEPTGEEKDDAVFDVPRIFELLPNFDVLLAKLQMYQTQHNEISRGSRLDLVFFKDAMTHLIKVLRILRTDNGNALLVGVGGSGKRSLTRLASFIAGYKIFQITLTRSYNMNNFMDDLKVLYKVAGAEGRSITFIFTDNDIKDEAFLEYLNNVLSSGEVSNLFAKDEMQDITQSLISVMKKELPRVPPTFDNLYEYFISRAKKNLHVVLCFSPVGQKFRSRCLKFPGLISGCTMDWFSPWPKEALVAVSSHFLSEFEMKCTKTVKTSVMTVMGTYHEKVSEACESYFERFRRRTHVTPKSYLCFINGYKALYTEKCSFIITLADRMSVGLNKLKEAGASVTKLSADLEIKEKELAVASVKAEKVLAEVTVSAEAATTVKNEVQVVKDRAQNIVEGIAKEKAVAENKLEAAKPALKEATEALNTIKPADIATVKKLANPPNLIMRIMDGVLILFKKKVDRVSVDPERQCIKPSWGEALKLLGSPGLLTSLQQFPKEEINEEVVELLLAYFDMPDYTMTNAKKVCGNVAGLLAWTRAMATYFAINKEVLPLKANLFVQERRLNVANDELSKAEALLAEKQKEFDEVQAKYDAAMKEKRVLLDDAEMCKNKMQAASALLDGLSDEKARWTSQSKQFQSQINRLAGDVLQLTGFLSYCGPFNQSFRDMLIKGVWEAELRSHNIPFTENLNVISALVDPPTISEWNLQGLPGDDLSVQNGIIVTKAARYPLLIDPQTQGKSWVLKKEEANALQVTSLNHKLFRTHLEDCLSLGRPLLIADISEELDPALDNVLEKNYLKSGTSFKELEAERLRLIEDVTANKRKTKELEDNLLAKLSSTKGSLVDDDSMISILRTTKKTAAEVGAKLSVAAEAEMKINSAQAEYRPVASRGSILYFLITEMSMVNVMYQTSLSQFLKIFDLSLERSEVSSQIQMRISNIIDYLTFEVFRYTVRGLYENNKFTFTLLLALKIDLQNRKIKHEKFLVLIKGGAALDLKTCPTKPFSWIPDMVWLNLVELSKLPQFSNIISQVSKSGKIWKAWLGLDAPERALIPDGYHSLDVFHKLLLIRSWCPDRTLPQAVKYVEDSLGPRFSEPVLLDLRSTWQESDPSTPLICFLSMGSDPSVQIEALAKTLQLECRAISMGQGQEVHARKLVKTSMTEGGWVLLQNCHLGLAFMDELFETITAAESKHYTFRVWITTEPHDRFSIALLQASIKFTNDPPQGIRAGLMRTFAGISQSKLASVNLPLWNPLLYSVAFLHSVVQERRKFGPLGWNIPYEFNSSDFSSSIEFIERHLLQCGRKKEISWVTVQYMIAEVLYGGRVTDDYDKRLLNCFAQVWFSNKMTDPDFCFYTNYGVPVCKTVEKYLEYIQGLPAVDSPQALGLHPNANITYQTNTSAEVLDTITNIQPKESGGGLGATRESIVYKVAEDMLNKLPSDYVPHEVKARLQKMGALNPLTIFLRQEVDRMQRVISAVRTSLTDLKLAIDGTIIMSDNLRDALDNIFDARVPNLWRKMSWESSTLGFWFTELLERHKQFSDWLFQTTPKTFWMTGFFNPQGFLTAVRQEATRANKTWALDTVTLSNKVLKVSAEQITASPNEGVYIHGLFLDGAGWNWRKILLEESSPKVLFSPMPVIHMFAVKSTQTVDPKLYVCPIYKKPRRTDLNYITAVVLPTVLSPDHWVLRGVALLCDSK
nr:dynein axonemal heavy chain 8 isoform X2 [Nothobranchius furzeri]